MIKANEFFSTPSERQRMDLNSILEDLVTDNLNNEKNYLGLSSCLYAETDELLERILVTWDHKTLRKVLVTFLCVLTCTYLSVLVYSYSGIYSSMIEPHEIVLLLFT